MPDTSSEGDRLGYNGATPMMLFRRNALRIVYGLGLAGYTGYGYWYLTDYMPAFGRVSGIDIPKALGPALWIFGIAAYLVIAAPLAALAVRPMWWGKFLMLMFLAGAPMAWVASRFIAAVEPPLAPQIHTVANFAYAFATLAVIQQVIDPTVWRPPRTWLSSDCPPPWPFGRKVAVRARL